MTILPQKASLSGQPTGVTLLPISFVVKDGQNGEWQYTAAESPLEVSFGKRSSKQTVSLESLPAAPLINLVAGATSSFAGEFGSPTLFSNTINNFIERRVKNYTYIERKAIETGIKTCLPLVRNMKLWINACTLLTVLHLIGDN